MVVRDLLAVSEGTITIINRDAQTNFFGATYMAVEFLRHIFRHTLDSEAVGYRSSGAENSPEAYPCCKGIVIIKALQDIENYGSEDRMPWAGDDEALMELAIREAISG